MLSFENFVKLMPPSLSGLKVTPSFCFALKIPDDRAVTKLDPLDMFGLYWTNHYAAEKGHLDIIKRYVRMN